MYPLGQPMFKLSRFHCSFGAEVFAESFLAGLIGGLSNLADYDAGLAGSGFTLGTFVFWLGFLGTMFGLWCRISILISRVCGLDRHRDMRNWFLIHSDAGFILQIHLWESTSPSYHLTSLKEFKSFFLCQPPYSCIK